MVLLDLSATLICAPYNNTGEGDQSLAQTLRCFDSFLDQATCKLKFGHV